MHGGRRYGTGRPKGAKTKKTQAVAMKAAAEGITPLEYMLETLRSAESTDEEKPMGCGEKCSLRAS